MKKRLFSIVISMLLLAQAALPGMVLAESAGAVSQDASLNVSVTAEMNPLYDAALQTKDETTVKIVALDGAPEPDKEELTFTTDESAAQSVSVHLDQLGVYKYEITQTAGSHPSATEYDSSKYLWTVYVLREDTGIVTTQVLKLDGKEYGEGDPKESAADFTNEYAETHATVEKVWVDDDNHDGMRPDSLLMTLSDGKTMTLDENVEWKGEITGLPALDAGGDEIAYSWTEPAVIEEYSFDRKKSATGREAVFYNEYTPNVTTFTVTKKWVDGGNAAGLRQDVDLQVQGYIEGIKIPVVTRNVTIPKDAEGEDLSVTVENLPMRFNFKNVTYSVAELSVPEGYEASVEGGVVTNTIIDTKDVEISGTKTWVDGGKEHDNAKEIRLTLKRTSAKAGSEAETVEAEPVWTDDTYKFSGLDQYDDEGYEYTYAVEEAPVEGYDTKQDGNNFTNTQSLTEVTVKKVWDDAENQDGKRPASLKVKLLADGDEVDEVELSEKNGWTATLSVPRYNGGSEIVYEWDEGDVPGYEADIDVSGNVTTITNRHEAENITFTVFKKWVDRTDPNARPLSITVYLKGSDNSEYSDVLSEFNDWATTFTVPRYMDGKEIAYTWSESNVPGYTMTVSREGATVTIINTRNSNPPGPTPTPTPVPKDDTPEWTGLGPIYINVGDCLE